MYLRYYGFSAKPFELLPKLQFLCLASGHRQTIETLREGLNNRVGWMVLTGEAGTGKTFIIHRILENPPPLVKTSLIFHPTADYQELLEQVLKEFGVETPKGGIKGLNDTLLAYLEKLKVAGEICAVFIDEAQALSKEALAGLFSLFTQTPPIAETFQLVLVGQPELEATIDTVLLGHRPESPGLRVKINPLTREEALDYIDHRLRTVGGKAAAVFSLPALNRIIEKSGGIPRILNTLCENALLTGYTGELKRIEVEVVEEVIGNLEGPDYGRHPGGNFPLRRKVWGTTVYPSLRKAALLALFLILTGFSVWLGRDLWDLYFGPKGTARNQSLPQQTVKRLDREPLRKREFGKSVEGGTEAQGRQKPMAEPAVHLLRVQEGETISKLTTKIYGRFNESLIDLTLMYNPSIKDADHIMVGQVIRLPELREETLIFPDADGSFHLHLGTLPNLDQAALFKNKISCKGEVTIKPKKISSQETYYRVEAGRYRTRQEALEDIQTLKNKGHLLFVIERS